MGNILSGGSGGGTSIPAATDTGALVGWDGTKYVPFVLTLDDLTFVTSSVCRISDSGLGGATPANVNIPIAVAGKAGAVSGAQCIRIQNAPILTVASISGATGSGTAAATAKTHFVYICTAALTFTFADAASATTSPHMYTVKNRSGGTITIATTSSQTIDGSAPVNLSANQSITLISDGANWVKIAQV